jgi:hypothetical protein
MRWSTPISITSVHIRFIAHAAGYYTVGLEGCRTSAAARISIIMFPVSWIPVGLMWVRIRTHAASGCTTFALDRSTRHGLV